MTSKDKLMAENVCTFTMLPLALTMATGIQHGKI